MRRRVMLVVTIAAIVLSGIFGYIKKQTYTNITSEEHYLDTLQVALLPEDMVKDGCEQLEKNVSNAPIILKGKASGKMEHLFQTGRQKIKITQVYKGETLQTGDEIYIYSERWLLSLFGNPPSVERGFVNIMQEEREYLLFLSETIEAHDTKTPVYKMYNSDFLIVPMFCYDDMEKTVPEVGGENTYVSYSEVKDNEIFCTTEQAYEIWKQLKRKLFAEYK